MVGYTSVIALPPTGGDGRGRYVGDQGARHLPPPPLSTEPNRWRARAPITASTAEGPRGLDSGSSGLVRGDLGVADHDWEKPPSI